MHDIVDTVRIIISSQSGEELANRDFNYDDCKGVVTGNLAGDKRSITCIGLKDDVEVGWGQTQHVTIHEGVNDPTSVEVCPVWYSDVDGDFYSDGTNKKQCDDPGENYYQTLDLIDTKGDCDDSDAAIHPGATEICNGIDDDCDDTIDEDYQPVTTKCGEGPCTATGTTSCVNGTEKDSCTPGTGAADDTTCDGVDDDCDGSTDEDYQSIATTCGEGRCKSSGKTSCVNGVVEDSCKPGTGAADDTTCDGVDDDCDGSTDEDYQSIATTCGEGPCESSGTTSCVNGVVEDSCKPGTGAADDTTCDGVDDDCDDSTDEDYQSIATTCGEGACESTGTTSCVNGKVEDSCKPGTGAADDATCDGLDDDCDGSTDEDYQSIATTCGEGACESTGTTSCVNGKVEDSCTPGTGAADDATCNGVDDDCDGSTDEDYQSMKTICGEGACESTGTTSCVNGKVEDSCKPGTGAADDTTCNGVDDDCDGSTDEDYQSMKTICGEGACKSTGTTSCVNGVVEDSCTPGTGAADDTTCNGVDDDCDGSTDEDYIPTPTTCGLGECAATGYIECQSGQELDTCQAGNPVTEICDDGLDNDCDGLTDGDDPDCVD